MSTFLFKVRVVAAIVATIILIAGITCVTVGAGARAGSPVVLAGILLLTAGLMSVWIGYVITRGVHAHMMILDQLKQQ